MKLLKVLILTFVFLALSFNLTSAFYAPNFPTCSNPQGIMVANYESGIHGVVGGNSYSGSDKVYKFDGINLIQCLCTVDGMGIQTNWWKASSLDDIQINKLKSEGWIYIPTGSVWGLDQDTYLAKNINYSCTSDNGTGGGSDDSVTNTIGQVLGLAFTGNIKVILMVFVFGILFIIYGQILHRARN
jgi:hypothetical protein